MSKGRQADESRGSRESSNERLVVGTVQALSADLDGLSIEDNASCHHDEAKDRSQMLCSICQEQIVYPVRLLCDHTFCYLCIKGAMIRSGCCALCRRPIPVGYLDRPGVVDPRCIEAALKKADSFQWYYEARSGGWWMYEERTSQEIEKAYETGVERCRVQIFGFSYVVDFKDNVQFREDIPERKRKIKRDNVDNSAGVVKGVAGAWIPAPKDSHIAN